MDSHFDILDVEDISGSSLDFLANEKELLRKVFKLEADTEDEKRLIPAVWKDYIKFSFNMKEVALIVSKKALRHCPWSEELWVWRLRVLEHFKFGEEEVVACFEKGLSNTSPSSQFNLWLYYLKYNCKSFQNSTVKKIYSRALQQITPEKDPTFQLRMLYARFEAERGCVTKAKKIWTKIILTDPNMKVSANAWLEFARFQRQYGKPSGVRYGFRNALNCCKDSTTNIGEEWLMFERKCGSHEEVIKCKKECEEFKTNLEKRVRNKCKNVLPSTSRIIKKNPKTSVFVNNLCYTVTEQHLKDIFPNALNVSIVLNRNGKSRCFAYIQFANKEDVLSALARDRIPLKGRPVQIFPMFSRSIKVQSNEMSNGINKEPKSNSDFRNI